MTIRVDERGVDVLQQLAEHGYDGREGFMRATEDGTIAWLIERGPNEGQLPHCWLLNERDHSVRPSSPYSWVTDAAQATKFATAEEEAEAVGKELWPLPLKCAPFAITQHVFIGCDREPHKERPNE